MSYATIAPTFDPWLLRNCRSCIYGLQESKCGVCTCLFTSFITGMRLGKCSTSQKGKTVFLVAEPPLVFNELITIRLKEIGHVVRSKL